MTARGASLEFSTMRMQLSDAGTLGKKAQAIETDGPLIYMSTQLETRASNHELAKALIPWPGSDGRPQRRMVFVSKAIHELIKDQRRPAGFTRIDLIRFLDRYRGGLVINISTNPRSKNAEIKPLENGNGVWSLKIQRPKPGWRFLGYFFEKDTLALLVPEDRIKLAGDWTKTMEECQQEWAAVTAQTPPLLGTSVDIFCSGPYYEC